MQDNIYLQRMINKIQEYRKMRVKLQVPGKINKLTWEKFLIDNGAMNEDGSVIAEYPKVVIAKSNGEREAKDCGGDLEACQNLIDDLKREGKSAYIDYYPRFYSYFLLAKQELNL